MSDNIELWNDDDENDPRRLYQNERAQILHPVLHIAGLAETITNDGLYNLFSKFGTVLKSNTKPSKKKANTQIGFVTYDSMDSAQLAIQKMDHKPPHYLVVTMKLPPKQEIPNFCRDSEPSRARTDDRNLHYSSEYGCRGDVLPDSLRAYNSQRREVNNFSRDRNKSQVEESDNFEGDRGPSGYREFEPRQNKKRISWGDVADDAIDISVASNSEPKFRNVQEYPNDGRHFGRRGKHFSNMVQRGMRGKNYNYKNTADNDAEFARESGRYHHSSFRNVHDGPDFEYNIEESNRDEFEEIDCANLFNDGSTVKVTVTGKGRSIELSPQLSYVPEVKISSTCTALSNRPEFSAGAKKHLQHNVEDADYEMPRVNVTHGQQFADPSFQDQGMVGERDYTLNSGYRRETQREYRSSNVGSRDMKKPNELSKQSTYHKDNKHRYGDRKENCSDELHKPRYQPKAMDHRIEAREQMAIPSAKTEQLPMRTAFKCVISHAENPDVLWIQSRTNVEKLTQLAKQLRGLLRQPDANNLIPRMNGVYLIEYESSWYRGKIIQINRNDKYNVLLVDYGRVIYDISGRDMSLLSHTNLNVPYCALKCKISPQIIKKYKNSIEIFEAALNAEVDVKVDTMNGSSEVVSIDISKETAMLTKKNLQIHQSLQLKNNDSDFRKTLADLPEVEFKIKDSVSGVVLYIESSEYVVVCLDRHTVKLDELTKLLNKSSADTPAYSPIKGELVLAKFEDDDWYRAEVMEISTNQRAKVIFIDYGNKEMVFFKDIRPITSEALKFPQLGLVVSLYRNTQSLPELNLLLNKMHQMKIINDSVNPMLVDFLTESKSQTFFVCQHLKTAHVELGAIKANFGIADEDSIYIIPSFNQDLISALQKLNSTASADNSSYQPRSGELCLAFSNDSWNRAACISVILNPKKFTVLLFDYGYTEEIDSVFLRPYAEELVKFPMMAVKCVVEGYPSEKNIRDKIQALETIEGEIEGDVIGIRKDYIEMQLI